MNLTLSTSLILLCTLDRKKYQSTPYGLNIGITFRAWRGVTVESVSNIIRFTPGLKYKRMVVELESPNDMSESENETITVSQTLRRAYEQELPPTPMPPVKRRRGRPKKQCLPMTAVQPPMHRR